MVITKPFPNMPIGFWGPGGEKRYHAAYFEAYPQKQPAVWTHGDWIEIHSLTRGVLVLGRSDGVLNPAGVRFGSAEIYNVVEQIEEVEDCLAIGQKLPDGDERLCVPVFSPRFGFSSLTLVPRPQHPLCQADEGAARAVCHGQDQARDPNIALAATRSRQDHRARQDSLHDERQAPRGASALW